MSQTLSESYLNIAGRSRVAVENVCPQIDCGRFPIKRVVGDSVVVEADIFGDGHDAIAAALLYRFGVDGDWLWLPMRHVVNDRWTAEFRVEHIGFYQYKVAGWIDAFGTWKRDLAKRVAAGQDVGVDLLIGADLVHAAAERIQGRDREYLAEWDVRLRSERGLVNSLARSRIVTSSRRSCALLSSGFYN